MRLRKAASALFVSVLHAVYVDKRPDRHPLKRKGEATMPAEEVSPSQKPVGVSTARPASLGMRRRQGRGGREAGWGDGGG